jgi:hypothetical protein
MAYADLMAMGPLRPEEIEANFVKQVLQDFISNYVIETQGQNLEEFDRLDLTSQKRLLMSGYYGYENISRTLEGFSKATLRIVGKRTDNHSRSEERFINARRRYLLEKKKSDLKRDEMFRSYLDYNSNNDRIPTPQGGRVYILTYLNNLPESDAKTSAVLRLSQNGQYGPNENITFSQDLINIFPALANQRAGKRRNRTKKLRRNKAKKTRSAK